LWKNIAEDFLENFPPHITSNTADWCEGGVSLSWTGFARQLFEWDTAILTTTRCLWFFVIFPDLYTTKPNAIIINPWVVKLWCSTPGGAVGPGGGGVCIRDTLILNEMWAQGKICILVGTLLGWNMLFIT
jgi:hypothetical protein